MEPTNAGEHATPVTQAQLAHARSIGAKMPPTCWDVRFHDPSEKTFAGKQTGIIASWTDAKGRRQYAYAIEAIAKRNERKFQSMTQFATQLPAIRKQVAKDLKSTDDATRACALVVSIIDQTGMRIGSARYVKDGAFGASSLLKTHTTILNAVTAQFDFIGKHRKRHIVEVKGFKIVKEIQRFMKTFDGAKLLPVSDGQVRRYLDRFGVDAKQFRTYHATELVRETLKNLGKPTNDADAKRKIVVAVKTAAVFLGNSPAMARGSYVDPVVLEDFAKQVKQ